MPPLGETGSSLRLPRRGLFITGTDTDVGKTYVAARIIRQCREVGCRVGTYKPVASGCDRLESEQSDAWQLWDAAGRPGRLQDVCPQSFSAPLAPHLAARGEGREVDDQRLFSGLAAWAGYDLVMVEGVGGLMSPISATLYVADVAEQLGWPLVIVARNQIGVINQVLQTLIVTRTHGRGLKVAGLVLNDGAANRIDASCASNPQEIALRCPAPLLAHVRRDDASELARVDWPSLAADHPLVN